MEEDSDFEVDPAIAAAMGFGGFGSQPNKKRKFDRDDGFVNLSAVKAFAGTGANSVATGERKSATQALTGTSIGPGEDVPTRHIGKAHLEDRTRVVTGSRPPEAPHQSLRNGIRNEQGDMAYFLHSFLEDPWQNLKPS